VTASPPRQEAGRDVVRLDDVTFGYGGAPTLKDVALTVHEGDFACFVGPNGGGKTTLFKLILGLLQPQRGRVRVFGQAPEDGRIRIGYVPQYQIFDPHFPIRVIDVVRMGLLGRKVERPKEVCAQALQAIGLEGRAGDWFSSLSGGQRQRVLVGRALATEADLLMLDEPTASVDAAAAEIILDLLHQLQGRRTVMLVTHSAHVVGRFIDMVYCVNNDVHRHPPTDQVDETLMRHICGYRSPGLEGSEACGV
jgi:zinc transport system ATP-binding protein